MGYGSRIREIRKSKNPKMTAKELAERADISATFLSDIERERKGSSASLETLQNIARALEVPLSHILKFSAETERKVEHINKLMDQLKDLNVDINKIKQIIEPDDLRIVEIPIISYIPPEGPVIDEENFMGFMPLPVKMVKEGQNFCLQVQGDSMEDIGINDGDKVLFHQQPHAENGQTALIRMKDQVLCKRIYIRADKCILEPSNAKTKAMNCTDFEIIGVVSKIIKEIQ